MYQLSFQIIEYNMEQFYFTSPTELDGFVASSSGGSLLQSWAWGEMYRNAGSEVVRLGLKDGDQIVAAVTLVKQKIAPGLFYWFSPRGPLVDEPRAATELRSAVQGLSNRALFWRLEPPVNDCLLDGRFVKTISLNPARSLFLDLEKTEEQLLGEMHPKTRYNIRLAAKKGVEVREITQPSAADWADFRRLLELTGSRDGFRLHAFSHYQNLVSSCPANIRLYIAYYQKQAVAAGLFSFWNDQAVYLHGASDNRFRQVMAPYLLQWTVIRAARGRGCRHYDFYGIDEDKWPGVTRFKRGFGGYQKEYPGTFDAVFYPFLYQLYCRLRHWRRRL